MRLAASLASILAVVSITSFCDVHRTCAAIRIENDPGGRIDEYLEIFADIRDSRERIIVDGACNSACTLLLGTIPRSRVCFTERASLGFHAAWEFDRNGNQVQSRMWTNVLWRNYPADIRDWITKNGGPTPEMIFLRGKELAAMYPTCRRG